MRRNLADVTWAAGVCRLVFDGTRAIDLEGNVGGGGRVHGVLATLADPSADWRVDYSGVAWSRTASFGNAIVTRAPPPGARPVRNSQACVSQSLRASARPSP